MGPLTIRFTGERVRSGSRSAKWRHRLLFDDKEVAVSNNSFRILVNLATQQIKDDGSPEKPGVLPLHRVLYRGMHSRTAMNAVIRLRQQLAEQGIDPQIVSSIYGVGVAFMIPYDAISFDLEAMTDMLDDDQRERLLFVLKQKEKRS